MDKQPISPSKIRSAAMDLLTGREFSRQELKSKLDRKFEGCSEIDGVLDQLQQDGLQSDERFTGSFLRSRVGRGQGPARIRLEIREKGINASLLEQVLEAENIDWYMLARGVAQRKFGPELPLDPRERAKRMRFLQYRGFSYDHIDFALSDNRD